MNESTGDRGRARERPPADPPHLTSEQVAWVANKMKDDEAMGIVLRRIKKIVAPILYIITSTVLVVGAYFQMKGWFGSGGGH